MSIAQFKAGTLVRVPVVAVKSRGFGPRPDGKGGRSIAMYTYADGRTFASILTASTTTALTWMLATV